MELQKVTQGMMKPSQNGNIELQTYLENKQNIKLRDLVNLEPLKEILRYCVILVGIKKDYLPSDAQKAVLIDFLTTRLGGYTPHEIKHAFLLAVEGRLNVSTNTYQSFDSIYVSDVLKAYKDYVTKKGYHMKLQQDETKQISENAKEAILKDSINKMIQEYNIKLKEGTQLKADAYGVFYNHLLHLELIKPSVEYRKNAFELAKKGIPCDNIRDKNDRGRYQAFKNNDCDKQNKYFVKCQLKAKSIIANAFFKECFESKKEL